MALTLLSAFYLYYMTHGFGINGAIAMGIDGTLIVSEGFTTSNSILYAFVIGVPVIFIFWMGAKSFPPKTQWTYVQTI
jgi:hypothetical protein